MKHQRRLMLVNEETISDRLRDASNAADKLFRAFEAGGSYIEQMKRFEAFRTDIGNRRREIMRLLRQAYGV